MAAGSSPSRVSPRGRAMRPDSRSRSREMNPFPRSMTFPLFLFLIVAQLPRPALAADADWIALGKSVAGERAARHYDQAEARVDPKMAAALPAGTLRTVWA